MKGVPPQSEKRFRSGTSSRIAGLRNGGAGSHGTLYLGDRFTVVKDLKKELGPGLLADMCKQLGIRKEDLKEALVQAAIVSLKQSRAALPAAIRFRRHPSRGAAGT